MDSGPQDDYHSYLSWLAMAPSAFGSGIASSLLATGVSATRSEGTGGTPIRGLSTGFTQTEELSVTGIATARCRDRPDDSVSGGGPARDRHGDIDVFLDAGKGEHHSTTVTPAGYASTHRRPARRGAQHAGRGLVRVSKVDLER